MKQNIKNVIDIKETGYDALAKAIIIQAAEDYKKYRFLLDTIDIRKYKTFDGKYRALMKAKIEIESAKIFFKSSWFEDLSGGLDGEKAMRALEQTYINEYYPARMKEWEETHGRAKGFIKIPNN